MPEIEELIQKLGLDKLKECAEEEPQPGLCVVVRCDCIVQLAYEVLNMLRADINLG
jgi:hypothetical protein